MSSTNTASRSTGVGGDRDHRADGADEVEPEPGVPAAVPFEVWAAR